MVHGSLAYNTQTEKAENMATVSWLYVVPELCLWIKARKCFIEQYDV